MPCRLLKSTDRFSRPYFPENCYHISYHIPSFILEHGENCRDGCFSRAGKGNRDRFPCMQRFGYTETLNKGIRQGLPYRRTEPVDEIFIFRRTFFNLVQKKSYHRSTCYLLNDIAHEFLLGCRSEFGSAHGKKIIEGREKSLECVLTFQFLGGGDYFPGKMLELEIVCFGFEHPDKDVQAKHGKLEVREILGFLFFNR